MPQKDQITLEQCPFHNICFQNSKKLQPELLIEQTFAFSPLLPLVARLGPTTPQLCPGKIVNRKHDFRVSMIVAKTPKLPFSLPITLRVTWLTSVMESPMVGTLVICFSRTIFVVETNPRFAVKLVRAAVRAIRATAALPLDRIIGDWLCCSESRFSKRGNWVVASDVDCGVFNWSWVLVVSYQTFFQKDGG